MTNNTDYVYVLRCVNPDFISSHGFRWPRSGSVECPDWNPEPECGGGLHGWLWGEGDSRASDLPSRDGTVWLVVKVLASDVVNLDGKVKFPRGEVVFHGNRGEAAAEIRRLGAVGAVIGLTLISSGKLEAMGGDYSKLTGGAYSKLTGGRDSVLSGGYGSVLTGGYGSKLTGGRDSVLSGGYGSVLTGGDRSTLSGGYGSKLSGGYGSKLTGGTGSVLTFSYFDTRHRLVTVYVGENSIEPGVAYKCETGVVVKA